jgi:signal peptidase I
MQEQTAPQTEIKVSSLYRTFRLLGNTLFVILILFMSLLVFSLIQSRVKGGPPTLAGHQMYMVLSGSMSPAFDTGSLIFVRPQPPQTLQVGDIITFRSSSGEQLTTHRIVEVMDENILRFRTRGDANNTDDPNPVPASNVLGRVSYAAPYLGYVMDFAQTKKGLIALIFVPGIIIIIFELKNLLYCAAVLEEEKKQKAKADTQTESVEAQS